MASLTMLTSWTIWNERNVRVFGSKSDPTTVLLGSIKSESYPKSVSLPLRFCPLGEAAPPTPSIPADQPYGAHTKLGGDSSVRGSGGNNRVHGGMEVAEEAAGVANFQLMYMAQEGSTEGIHDLIDACADPNFRGIDYMKMHIPACEEHALVVQLLLKRGAARWPSWFFCRGHCTAAYLPSNGADAQGEF
ncbi:hypothetical protein ACQ4PT_021227 [Festuca glaucescens]